MNKKGFTFIEVIIIFTIIFIMTAVMMSMSYKERASKEITTVAHEVVASIREAQNNALTGKQRGNDQLPCAFKFGLVNLNSATPPRYTGYQMFHSARDLDGTCPVDDATGVSTSFFNANKLPGGMTIFARGKDTNNVETKKDHIIFKVPYGGFIIKDNGSDNEAYVGSDIIIEKGDKRYHICVHSTGLIEELGFKDAEFACPF